MELKRPVMLHRVIFGSIERFIGIIIEHFAGAFPLWLSPVQVNVIPVNNEYHFEYAEAIKNMLIDNNIRTELDSRNEKLGYKMRESQTSKIPYTIITGDKEVENGLISYRKYGTEETVTVKIEEFIDLLKKQIDSKE